MGIGNFKDLIINKSVSILEAIKQLDKTAKKILFVVDDNGVYIGSLSDGDIRRYILKRGSLDGCVLDAVNRNSFYVKTGYDRKKVLDYMKKKDIKFVPVVNDEGIIVEFLINEEISVDIKTAPLKKIDIPVVIMAGGFGTRLDPFTRVLPKPLIPIGDKTVLEIIIEKFLDYGIEEIWLSVNYKAYIIKSYLSEINLPCKINYIQEDKPLGTIGSLYLIKGKIKSDKFILINCDTIIDVDYFDLLEFHISMRHDITMISSAVKYTVPYGVCKIKDGLLEDIEEKPSFNFLVNTGMYLINAELLSLIPKNQPYNATDFVKEAINRGFKVGIYPISEDAWIDIGQWQEYKKAIERLKI